MSIIGPRPHMLSDCNEFASIIANYELRNTVKPGITGIAQVKGYRGITKDHFDVWHRYKWDMFYIRNQGFLLDLKILKLTLQTILTSLFKSVKEKQRDSRTEQVNFQLEKEYLN